MVFEIGNLIIHSKCYDYERLCNSHQALLNIIEFDLDKRKLKSLISTFQ